jgi:hypothetical protein
MGAIEILSRVLPRRIIPNNNGSSCCFCTTMIYMMGHTIWQWSLPMLKVAKHMLATQNQLFDTIHACYFAYGFQ